MYGMEHGILMHGVMVACTWLVFIVLCLLPFVLLYGAYAIGLRHGRELTSGDDETAQKATEPKPLYAAKRRENS